MEPTKKISADQEEGTDRLSNLPEDIIHHIFSFMETKYVIRTSVLSRRWINLWTFLPTLNFNCNSFGGYTSFKKFVRQVLSRRHPCELHSLKFRTSVRDKSFRERVIRYAVSKSVQEIHILRLNSLEQPLLSCISLKTTHIEGCLLTFDDQLFSTCVNLETLVLKSVVIVTGIWLVRISAPRLERVEVHFSSVQFTPDIKFIGDKY